MDSHDPADSSRVSDERIPALDAPRRDLLADPRIQFPVIGLVLLLIIWTGMWTLIDSEYRGARQAAATNTVKLAFTYEAQVVRALREVDLTLKFVQYASETGTPSPLLPGLGERNLLPPDFLFVVSITDSEGRIVESTRDAGVDSVAGLGYFEDQRQADSFLISPPQFIEATQTSVVHFSRRLSAGDGSFAGIAMATVDAGFFVSGYEASDLGTAGVLGILGTDDIFRARRTGDMIVYGEMADYASSLPAEELTEAEVSINPWDQVPRYTAVRELFGFPVAIVVGLSEEEQLNAVRERAMTQGLQALFASLVTLIGVAILGRMSWQLQRSRMQLMAEQVSHAQRVEYFAYHDNLTGLANRSLFSQLLGHSLKQAQRNKRSFSLLFMDLDRFKFVNDTLGHDAGDELLREVARRLNASIRDSDTVARLGGDEFVVLLPEQNDAQQLTLVSTRILDAVRKPFRLGDQDLRVTVSIGISSYPQDGHDEQTLLKNADIAMYNAKKAGKNAFRFYSESLQAESLEHRALEANLRLAVERQELRLHYQARKNIDNGSVTGVEALLRWQHPELGLLAPDLFLPMAEKTGLIIPIGRWVLDTACRQSVVWDQAGSEPIPVSVNLSAREFYDEDLLKGLTEVLQKTGMDPNHLNLEVAESLLMRDFDNALRILKGITDLGVHISLDNFGAGYFSLAMLKQVRLDTIKVDETFIRDITRNAEDKHLMEAIITMARVLGLKVVAEGVETHEQASFLAANSCDEIQGNYVSEVLPAAEMSAFMNRS
jgi:diguanylate cyclase (GGDEF)-like protein